MNVVRNTLIVVATLVAVPLVALQFAFVAADWGIIPAALITFGLIFLALAVFGGRKP